MYFDDEDNSADPVIKLIEQQHRRETLLAKRQSDGTYLFEIYLQGDKETVFFDV